MRESFSKPESFYKQQATEEIAEGLDEWSSPPDVPELSMRETQRDLAREFEFAKAETPFKRSDIENDVREYIEENFSQMLPLLLGPNSNHEITQQEIIATLGITNEQIGLLGANYYIRDGAIFKSDEYHPEGYAVSSYDVSSDDLLAFGYAAERLRVDVQRTMRGAKNAFPHRYLLRSKGRYLCANDFGMKVFKEDEGLVEGDVTNAEPFVKTVKREFERISANLVTFRDQFQSRFYNQALAESKDATVPGEGEHHIQSRAGDLAYKRANEQLSDTLLNNPKDRELVLTAIPTGKVQDHLHFNYAKIAARYGLTGMSYEDFKRHGKGRLDQLFRDPRPEEKAGASVDYVYSTFYHKPVIVTKHFNSDQLIKDAERGVGDLLLRDTATNDPAIGPIFTRFRSTRVEGSPYFYSDASIYEFIKAVGPEAAKEALAADDRQVSEQMIGYEYLQALGFDPKKFKSEDLKKQLHQAYTLSRANIWSYLKNRGDKAKAGERDNFYSPRDSAEWLADVNPRKRKNLFYEGKRMYWLAKQVYMNTPGRTAEDRFYKDDASVNWEAYDLSQANITDEQFNTYFEKHKNFIIALLSQGNSRDRYGAYRETDSSSANLALIIKALEKGQELRGVAIAKDKKRYLQAVIKGENENDLELAFADWPVEWLEALTKEEIQLYYEYADDNVLRSPDGLIKYAEWRASAEGKEWQSVFADAPNNKGEFDFRLCLGGQTPEIRGWYKSAAEYVGGGVVQNYLLRFNATRGADGQFANWHDVLFWVPNINKLEAQDARSVLNSIQTMDDNQEFINLLPRYSKERDPLKQHPGGIQSLRELKKRILAIESNINLADFPPELLEITTAPGFNLSTLERMRHAQQFKDLLEGKLDKEQPFKPHNRIFCGRNLSEALDEGLGSMRQKRRGTAKDPKGFFHSLGQLVKGREVSEGKKLQVTDLLKNVPIDLEQEIIKLLQEQNVDIGPMVEAQVHAKSDPEGWVCGNYTDCCMPFGDYKNDDYMFNPSTQYFTIKYNGRIIAQSVVTDGRDNRDNSDVVILDNIEVASNYKNLSPLLSKVYQTFWTEYTSKPVKVGTGYSDLIPPGGRLEENNYRAKTSLAYSDATGGQIYDLPRIRGVESLDEIISFANLTERDAELIAKLETEAYPAGMVQGKTHIADILKKQRELEVPGAASSFVVRQGQEPAGYLLVLPEESETNPGEHVAHLYDMAVLPKFRGTPIARKMMERTLDIASAYNVPIEAEARANTSYALLLNQRVRRWFESKGFYLTKNEKLPKYLGNEDFYFVRFDKKPAEAQAV